MYPYNLNDDEYSYTEQNFDENINPTQLPPSRPPFGGGFQPDVQRPPTNAMPSAAPPHYIPDRGAKLKAVDPGAIRHCVQSFTYIWLANGRSFWMYPTFIGRHSISGYRWTRFGWTYTGFDISLIESFYCPRT